MFQLADLMHPKKLKLFIPMMWTIVAKTVLFGLLLCAVRLCWFALLHATLLGLYSPLSLLFVFPIRTSHKYVHIVACGIVCLQYYALRVWESLFLLIGAIMMTDHLTKLYPLPTLLYLSLCLYGLPLSCSILVLCITSVIIVCINFWKFGFTLVVSHLYLFVLSILVIFVVIGLSIVINNISDHDIWKWNILFYSITK